jgi:serine/threonine-protein kinase HipA
VTRTIGVFLGGEPRRVGTLRFDAEGARENAAFEYDGSWLRAPERFALAPTLPLVAGPQFHRKLRDGSVFHSVIADTEPDGWGRRVILRDHAKQRERAPRRGKATEGERNVQRAPLGSLDFLLAVDDFSRAGALRFQDEQEVFQRAPEDGRRTAPPLIQLGTLLRATRAFETNTETAADLAFLRGKGTSLGGARPKCTVVDEAGHLSIGKFPSVADERPVTKGEVLALRLAAAAKIRAAEAHLIDSDGSPVALIRRFDRAHGGGRLMYVSAATMLGVEPGDVTTHTYTELVDALRQHGAAAQDDIEELWRRMVFSVLITNVDDHLLNHGFLHVEHGKWRLSPAFDLNPFPERVRELKTWISEETGPEASVRALRSVTRYFGLTTTRASRILREVASAVAGWRKTGRALGMSKVELDQFAPAFEHPELDAAAR